MQAADLIKYIENPRLLDQQSIGQLQKLVNDFPYFQPAHLLLSMASRKWDASTYQQSLKKTAIVAPNRTHLFNLLHRIETEIDATENDRHSPTPVQKQTQLKKPDSEEVLEKEIEKGVVNSFVEKEILKTPELHKSKNLQEPESFVEWLSLLKKNNGQPNQSLHQERPKLKPRQEEEEPEDKMAGKQSHSLPGAETETKKERQKALIDKIIENNPGIIRNKEDQKFFSAGIKARESLLESEHLVTETLAKIYALQGSVNKAVRAYEILSLKYPQKSAYFATLIEKLKNNP